MIRSRKKLSPGNRGTARSSGTRRAQALSYQTFPHLAQKERVVKALVDWLSKHWSPYKPEKAVQGIDGQLVCDTCFREAGWICPERWSGEFGVTLAPEIAEVIGDLVERRLALCSRCRQQIEGCNEDTLRWTVAQEVAARYLDSRDRPSRLLQSEIAITLASWTLIPRDRPALSRGCAFINRIFGAYPIAQFDNGPASVLERDLGYGVVGVFTVTAGELFIDNFVSHVRRQGHARRALRDLCALADRYGAVMVGVVQPNPYNGLPLGADTAALLNWYRGEGFVTIESGGVMIKREPSPVR
jgi:hypothetical protein